MAQVRVALSLALGLAACGGSEAGDPAGAGASEAGRSSEEAATIGLPDPDSGVLTFHEPDAHATDAAAPTVHCDDSDASLPDSAMWDPTCTLPPSFCADQRNLVYATDGECVAGLCHFTMMMLECGAASACFDGGCIGNVTAAPAP